jgi:hypothetical protein
MKFVASRPFANPEVAARKLIELANAFEPVQDGRIYIEKINGPFLFELKGTPVRQHFRVERYPPSRRTERASAAVLSH